MGSVFEGFNDARKNWPPIWRISRSTTNATAFYATGPGQTFQNIGEVVSGELFEAIHGDPTNTRTAQFLNATGDFISDWWNNKESAIASAKTTGKPRAIRCPTLSSKPMENPRSHGRPCSRRCALPGHDRITRSKRRGHGAQGLGDLVSQAATFIGKADKTPDARKALEQLAAEVRLTPRLL